MLETRLNAAVAGLQSIIVIDKNREGIISTLNDWLALKDKVIEDYKKIDANTQTRNANSGTIAELFRANATTYEKQIDDLRGDLASCKSDQKLIALGTALGAGYLGYRYGQATANSNSGLLNFNTTNSQHMIFRPTAQSRAEEAFRKTFIK